MSRLESFRGPHESRPEEWSSKDFSLRLELLDSLNAVQNCLDVLSKVTMAHQSHALRKEYNKGIKEGARLMVDYGGTGAIFGHLASIEMLVKRPVHDLLFEFIACLTQTFRNRQCVWIRAITVHLVYEFNRFLQ